MTRQYLRKCSLVVGDPTGQGIDLSELQIRFNVMQPSIQTPGNAQIRVYNLAAQTSLKISKEFTEVQLRVGYGDESKSIFGGEIIQCRRGRESPTDTFLDILATTGDAAYNFCVTNHVLAAGWSQADMHKAIVGSMSPYGITAGYVPEMSDTRYPRGRVIFGLARDQLRAFTAATRSSWHFDEGQVNIVADDGYVPGEAIVMNSATGMIGLPVQTLDGVVVKSLMNPGIKNGRLLQINNESIQLAPYSPDYTAINEAIPSLDSAGRYRVYAVSHTGDTRGQAWYTEAITRAVDGTAPLTAKYIGSVQQ